MPKRAKPGHVTLSAVPLSAGPPALGAAVALTAKSLSAGKPVLGKPVLGPSPEKAAEFIERELRPQVEAGDYRALLDAIDLLARAGTLPPWIATAYITRYAPWRRNDPDIKTLDAAFRIVRPKHMRLEARARRKRLKPQILARISEARAEGRSLGKSLFDDVGKSLGVSGSYVDKVYYEPENKDREYFNKSLGLDD